ncbi:LOW QUALITY PROTEIN: hypothetical protein MC885_015764 [Smutsia gigantea]|nr:LOW QUALITY PROTEIN: hypothetical protein MC885_015764 [Smutsia gigantea]
MRRPPRGAGSVPGEGAGGLRPFLSCASGGLRRRPGLRGPPTGTRRGGASICPRVFRPEASRFPAGAGDAESDACGDPAAGGHPGERAGRMRSCCRGLAPQQGGAELAAGKALQAVRCAAAGRAAGGSECVTAAPGKGARGAERGFQMPEKTPEELGGGAGGVVCPRRPQLPDASLCAHVGKRRGAHTAAVRPLRVVLVLLRPHLASCEMGMRTVSRLGPVGAPCAVDQGVASGASSSPRVQDLRGLGRAVGPYLASPPTPPTVWGGGCYSVATSVSVYLSSSFCKNPEAKDGDSGLEASR